MFNKQAAAIAHSWWLDYNWRDVVPTLWGAVHSGMYDMWFVGIPAASSYNSNLGTLLVELLGSYAIFSFIYLCYSLRLAVRWRYALHVLLILGFGLLYKDDPHYSVFFCGMFLADLYQNSRHLFGQGRNGFGLMLFILGVLLGAANIGNLPHPPYHSLEVFFRNLGMHPLSYPWAFGAVLLVVGLMMSETMQRIFEMRLFQVLGEYSFALFVTHTVFLGAVTSWVFVKIHGTASFGYTMTVLLAFAVSAPLLVMSTYFIKMVDDFAIRISRKI